MRTSTTSRRPTACVRPLYILNGSATRRAASSGHEAERPLVCQRLPNSSAARAACAGPDNGAGIKAGRRLADASNGLATMR